MFAATLLAYVPELGKIESGQLAALIGVAPVRPRQRAATSLPTCARRASFRVPVLYMAAVSAIPM
ncbi:MAG: hypothetical protein J6386_24230 [Candidatus Synoicihabitans palmerolidicus]|nr:hypothetical protein [Candidatus Synoicihabitans palmerolidicus]